MPKRALYLLLALVAWAGSSFTLGSDALPYTPTIDTGSGLLGTPCNTPLKVGLCGGVINPTQPTPDESQYIKTEAECLAAGIGCFSDSRCPFSQALTGNSETFNSPAGILVRETWAVENVAGQGSVPLSIPYGVIACTERAMVANGEAEFQTVTACPPPMTTEASGGIEATCPGDSSDAGWTFKSAPVAVGANTKTPSAIAIPQQVYDAGLIEHPVLSFCWPPRPQNADCSAEGSATNYAVFGPALPQGLKAKNLVEVPLVYNPPPPADVGGSDSSSQPATTHFLSAAAEAYVPVFGGGKTKVMIEEAENEFLWDTGAFGSGMVPQNVLDAYLDYYNAAQPGVQGVIEARFGGAGQLEFGVQDPLVVAYVCGTNFATEGAGTMPAQWVMTRYTFAAGEGTASNVRFVRNALSKLFPSTVDVAIGDGTGGGGKKVVVPLPGSVLVNGCGEGDATAATTMTSVTVCSPYRGGTRFWWAVPWFQGRFVQFDVSPAVQTETRFGVMRYAPISRCQY